MILAPFLVSLCSAAPADLPPSGRYVEARTASVFAGACHYGGERTTAGREALLAWSIDAGTIHGVDLAGSSIAAVVVDDVNLDDAPRARRAIVYVPLSSSAAQRAALVAWVETSAPALLGDVVLVKPVDLSVVITDEAYRATAAGHFDLSGDALPDRACCKMPLDVWYDPFVALQDRLVGRDVTFRFAHERTLERAWSRPGENAAFFGRFGPPAGNTSAAETLDVDAPARATEEPASKP